MGDPSIKSSRLEYATTPTVGSVTLRRTAPGAATLTFLPTYRKILAALSPLIICAILAGAAGLLAYLKLPTQRNPELLAILILPASLLLCGTMMSAGALISTLVPPTIEIGQRGLTLTERAPLSISHQTWPRAAIIDVFIDRTRAVKATLKRRYLLIRLTNGQDIALVRGSRPELEFARDTLRDEMRLGNDPLRESNYPPMPRWTRIKRRLLADGAALIVPAKFAWQWSVPSTPLLMASLFWIDRLVFTIPGAYQDSSNWAVFRVVAFTFILLVAILGVTGSWRRNVILIVHDGILTLNETSLFRPGRAEWPLAAVRSIEAVPTSRRSAMLRIIAGEETIEILKKRSPAQIDWIVRNLRSAFQVSHERTGLRKTPH